MLFGGKVVKNPNNWSTVKNAKGVLNAMNYKYDSKANKKVKTNKIWRFKI